MITREVIGLSTIVAVCGVNFCTFVADQRKVRYTPDGIDILSDKFKKIYRINDHLIYGAAGVFNGDEHPQDVFTGCADINTLSVKMAKNMVVQYMRDNADKIGVRNCIVGGRVHGDKLELYEIHWDAKKRKPVVTQRAPNPPKQNFAVSVVLPPFVEAMATEIIGGVEAAVTGSRTVKELETKLAYIIDKMSKLDPSVGGEPQIITITGR